MEPTTVSDLPAYFSEQADLAERARLQSVRDGNIPGASYFMGRRDAMRSAAGEVREQIGTRTDAEWQDEEAAAIERLDAHKFAGDPWVLQSAR